MDQKKWALEKQNQKLYVKFRLPELAADLRKLGEEKKKIAEKIKAGDKADPKALNQRRRYIATRITILKAEQGELTDMLKSLNDELRAK